nr:uncharacterized protein LOC109774834 [Aegilops tauschii subsp. strangulata]
MGNDKHSEHLLRQEVNTVVPTVPEYMHWSERLVSWTWEDHPAVMPTLGAYAIVLDPTIVAEKRTCKFSRVLIDGGSINILYCDTMTKLGIEAKQLELTQTVFHGIVSGLSRSPIDQIRLGVPFGTHDHFQCEPIWFEVVVLSSPVLILKKKNTWRVCIDYTSPNKACPKDPFALLWIDQVIDSMAGCELLPFMDAYSGYHRIKMDPDDTQKTSFITPFGAYCYIPMSFSLKNASATFQHCM